MENNEGACAQSHRAYGPEAADLARQAGWDITAEAFTACTGHLVEDLFNRRPGVDNASLWDWGLEQLDQDPPSRVDVLTFSFGGNDIGFVDLLFDCLPVPDSWVDAVLGSALTGLPAEVTGCDTPEAEVDARIEALVDPPRRDCVGGRQNDRRSDRDPDLFLCDLLIDDRGTADAGDDLRGSLVDFYVQLAEEHLTDRGRIVVVGYPNLFAPVGERPGWAKLVCQGVGRGDTERLNRLSANLDDALIRAVRAANERLGRDRIAFLPRSILYRDGSHELCGSGEDWLNGIAASYIESSFHPNLAGHQATAQALLTMLNDLTFDTGAIEADGAGIAGVGLEAPAGTIIDDLTQGLGPPDEDSGWREIDCLPGEPARERVVWWDALSVTITDDPGRWPEPVLSAWLVDARDGTPPAGLTVDPPIGVGDTWSSLADQGATWDEFYSSWELEGLTGILNTSTPDAPSTVTAFGAGSTGLLGC